VIFGPGERIPVQAKGRLIWQERISEKAGLKVGIEFTSIEWCEVRNLLAFEDEGWDWAEVFRPGPLKTAFA